VRLLKEPWIAEEDWVTKQGTLAALAGSGRKVEVGELVGAATQDRPRSTAEHLIEIAWSPADPVMVAAGLDGLAVDFLPLVSATSACEIALVLPGSSIKGSLRTAGERIARTLLKRTAPPAILDQVKVPLVEDLFGSASDAEGAGRMGAVAVEPCYSEDRICRSTWDDVILAKDDGSLRTALNGTQLDIDQAYHVTIDRWTGGAFPHALFSALEPRVDWEKIRLWIDLDRVPEARREAATILLALTLRDLAEGFVPLGFATNRGYGTVKVEALSGLPNEIQLRPDGNSRRWRIDASEAKKKELRRAWEDWLAEVGATGERK
jgi:CRISPR/Cas system CSM-associated protein Csm3 (group 7 of RAMP superfamily)